MSSIYTYAHYTADTGDLFYIGMGQGRRLLSKAGRNKHWTNKVNKHGFTAVKLAEWDTIKEAADHEVLLIACFRELGFLLVNKSSGGEYSASGFKHTEETKQLFSRQRKGNTFCLGYKHNDSAKEKMALSQIGRKHSEKTKQKMSLKQSGKNNAMFGKISTRRKKVICTTLGTSYSSLTQAALETGAKDNKISLVCQGKRKSTMGLVFKYD
jgi:hypothetical protein